MTDSTDKNHVQLNITYGELKQVLKQSKVDLPVEEFMLRLVNIKKENYEEE